MSVQQILAERERHGKALSVTGANTRIRAEGSGKAVVCMHGVPASAFVYRKVLPALASRGLRGVAFDLPGPGMADRPRGFDYSWTGLANWTVDALDAARLENFHLVVHDIGGPIGYDVLRRMPGRIRSLTVLITLVRVASFRRPWVMEPFAYPGLGWLWLQVMRTPMIIALMRMVSTHDGPGNDDLRAYGDLLVRGDGGRAFLKIMRGFEERIIAGLRRARCPAQVLGGAQDPALKMHEHAPAICEILGLPDWQRLHGKHFVQEDAPGQIAERVAALTRTARQ